MNTNTFMSSTLNAYVTHMNSPILEVLHQHIFFSFAVRDDADVLHDDKITR